MVEIFSQYIHFFIFSVYTFYFSQCVRLYQCKVYMCGYAIMHSH